MSSKNPDQSDDDILWQIINRIAHQNGLKTEPRRQRVLIRDLKSRLSKLNVNPRSYQDYLTAHIAEEKKAIIALLTIHYTYFFRETVHYDYILYNIISQRRQSHGGKGLIRILSAACSTGQEAYSAAMVLNSHWRDDTAGRDFEIVGVDLDVKTIETARNAVYPWSQIRQVPAHYLPKSMIRGSGELDDFWKVRNEIRKRCRFEVASILDLQERSDLGQFDFVFCRNVFLYFDDDSMRRAVKSIESRLNPEGAFAIGLCETITHLDLGIQSHGNNIFARHKNAAAVQENTSKPNIRVLCVDDSATITALLKQILSPEHGFEVVTTCDNGIKALERLDTLQFDAITLDLHMPELDGFGFLERVKGKTDLPIIVVSSIDRDEDGRKALELGARDYIEKPSFSNLGRIADELRNKLKSMVTNDKAREVSFCEFSPNAAKDKRTDDLRTKVHPLQRSESKDLKLASEQTLALFFGKDGHDSSYAVLDSIRELQPLLSRMEISKFDGVKFIIPTRSKSDLFSILEKFHLKLISHLENARSLDVRLLGEGPKLLVAQDSKTSRSSHPSRATPLKRAVEGLKKKVVIVDDSLTMRMFLRTIIQRQPKLELVAECDSIENLESTLRTLKPDLITLDIEMPRVNGLEWLKSGAAKTLGIPVVIVSSHNSKESSLVVEALAAGAIDFIQKPGSGELDSGARLIGEVLVHLAFSQHPERGQQLLLKPRSIDLPNTNEIVIAIGASTGGTNALTWLFGRFGKVGPPIVVTQHIPAGFSKAFADQLARNTTYKVMEAEDGMPLDCGTILVAPGGKQMEVKGSQSRKLSIRIKDAIPERHHNPSVDILFQSVKDVCGAHALGILLTGMGSDGAEGLLALRQAGAKTIIQDQESSIIYGMPRAAFELGAADETTPLNKIPPLMKDMLEIQTKSRNSA